jgi:hypothetical protein
MSLPGGSAATRNPARPADKRTNTEGLDPVRVRHLVNAGEWVAEEWGYSLRRRRVRDLVIRFMREGRADLDFRSWFIAYADPTGETAVRNVMREETRK